MRVSTNSAMPEALERRLLLSDPALGWSSYLGGTQSDYGNAIEVDLAGNAWIAGSTYGGGWASGGFDTTFNGVEDAFVSKINADGALAWSTYLGGSDADRAMGIAVDPEGNAWVVGLTTSAGWTAGGFDISYNGAGDGFVAKINADGGLAWSSYIGGTDSDGCDEVVIDPSGNAWITGGTRSAGWVSGGLDITHNGAADAFLAKITPAGSPSWSSYLGGSGDDVGISVGIDALANIWLAGWTWSTGWVSGGFDPTFNGDVDSFVAKVSAAGALEWSSYLGGTSSDQAFGIDTDAAGNAWVVGGTFSNGWTSRGFNTQLSGPADGFVAKVASGGSLAWSTYLGGSDFDVARGVQIDSVGNAWIVGYTESIDWARGGFDTTFNGGNDDAFLARINGNGNFGWSSYLGGSVNDYALAIALDPDQDAWVTGYTTSPGWTSGGFDITHNGLIDPFVAQISDPPDAVPPTVNSASFIFDGFWLPDPPHRLTFDFSENVITSLGDDDLVLDNLTSGTSLPSSYWHVDYDLVSRRATVIFPGFRNRTLPDGRYRAKLVAAGITDLAGNRLPADYLFTFFVLSGDTDHNGNVNLEDFNTLAQNFGQPDRTFSQGDFNYDRMVNLLDFNILAMRFGQVLAAPALAGPFSSRLISDEGRLEEML